MALGLLLRLGFCVNLLFTESVLDTFAFVYMNTTYTEVKLAQKNKPERLLQKAGIFDSAYFLISMKVHEFCLES